MYPLPADFDPSFLEGQIVESVSFSENTVHINFDGHSSITLEA